MILIKSKKVKTLTKNKLKSIKNNKKTIEIERVQKQPLLYKCSFK